MKVDSVKSGDKSTVELIFSVEAGEFEQAVEKAYRKERGRIQVAGFRKGKAPRKMIERLYGSGFFWETAVNDSYSDMYDKALEEAGIEAVGKGDIEVMDISENGYTIKAIVPVKPEITITEYKGLSAVRQNVAVGEGEVEDEIERMRKRGARIEAVSRPAADGDTAVIDYEGFADGKAFEGGKGERHSLVLGSNSFIPGFESQLVGKSAGENTEVSVTFPTEYHAPELAGKDAIFKVFIHEVKESVLPELDDEFAKDVSEFDTLAELRKDIEKNLRETREQQANDAFENAVIEQLADLTSGEIPDAMVDAQTDTMVQNMAYRLQSQGLDFNTYLQMTGMDAKAISAEYRPRAEKQVKIGLALEKIAELEKLSLLEEDVESEYNKLAEQYKMPAEQVKIFVNEAELRRDMLREKASKFVIDAAAALAPDEEPKPKKPKAAKSEAQAAKPAKKPAAKKPDASEDKPKKPAAKKEAEPKNPAAAKKPAAKAKQTAPAAKKPKKPAEKTE